MNFSHFFIDRPIFASMLSVLIVIAGLVSIPQLPVSEYPQVSPPKVTVSTSFPGANPKVIAETVATPLEEVLNGIENMLYMSSTSRADGSMNITLTFEIGTDPDLAQQQVQNRVSQALPRLPDISRQIGVVVNKSSDDLTMVVHLRSPQASHDMLYLRNYAKLNIRDRLIRIPGVSDARVFGSGDYAMRIWLNPNKLAARGITAMDITDAIREQNAQVSAGIIGGAPYSEQGVEIQLPISVKGRLNNVEEFADIIVATNPETGAITKLKDVARIEMGAASYGVRSLLNNQQAIAIGIFAQPDSNAIEISNNIQSLMAELKQGFPAGIDYSIVYDPTIFVRDSITSVIATLLEAVALVVLVVIVFLQTWRASIIPLLAVPVSIIGTFAFMLLFGYSINVLSLFGLILSIGIVVDDAIIVTENVERNIAEGLAPKEAAYQAMREVTGPVIATTLVLIAVFVPIAFVSGLTGQFYRQFAMTIAFSVTISSINSLTLSPAIAALLLKPKDAPLDALSRWMNRVFGGFFHWFNGFFQRRSEGYSQKLRHICKYRTLSWSVYGVLLVATYGIFQAVPSGFIPAQDKGFLIAAASLQDGASLDRTEEVVRQMSEITMAEEGIANAVAFPGLSFTGGFGSDTSGGLMFLPLKDFSQRPPAQAIAGSIQPKFMQISEANIFVFPPAPVRGLSLKGGFELKIQDRTGLGYEALDSTVKEVMQKAWQRPEFKPMTVYSGYKINVPQLDVNVDREKAKQLGVSITDIFNTMQTYLGSLYVNDFNSFGKTFQVIVQADAPYRSKPSDILNLKLRNISGNMVPLGAVVTISESYGPQTAIRYNAFLSAGVSGEPADGYSSGEAQDAMVEVLEETLPEGMDFEWTGITYQQILAGNTALYIFPLCALLVFMVLAAQYESLRLPLAVVLIVPMAILAAMLGVKLTGGDNNIFTQISLFVLMGLATKNAILIVEFARELERQGLSIGQAALESARLRLRPILMTSFAFIMGVLPMALAMGAGAEMRSAMGIAVFFGMLGVTFFGLFLTPLFYVTIRRIGTKVSAFTNTAE